VSVAAVLLQMLSCRFEGRKTPENRLVVVVGSLIRDVDPRFAVTNHDVKLSRLVAPGLTTADTENMLPRFILAESIEEVEPLRWRVTLRRDARFSNGDPVTAEDVVFTYMSTIDPAMKSLYRKNFMDRFKTVEAVDELRVDFVLVKPLGTFFTDLDYGIVQKKAAGSDGYFAEGKVVGAGPYRVRSYHEEKVVLERTPEYWGTPASTELIEVRTVRDGNARNLMLVGGSADFTQNGVRVDLVDFIAKNERLAVESKPSAILTYLMMHNEDSILSDVRVRHAIAMALDRRRIIEAKYGGRAILATGLLPPFHWAYEKNVVRYDHDLEAAGKLLDAAGYPDPDGPGGEPRFELTYKTSADDFRRGVAEVIAAQLGEVGIAVTVRSFEFGTFFADIKAGNYQLASMQTSAITEPDFYYTYFNSSRIPTPDAPYTHNRWRYRNARVDELTVLGRSTMEREQRVAIYREVQRILAVDLPVIPLWHEDNVAVFNKRVRGFEILPNARLSSLARVVKDDP
jgi:peptide/nickel transport system substrate-binding protein